VDQETCGAGSFLHIGKSLNTNLPLHPSSLYSDGVVVIEELAQHLSTPGLQPKHKEDGIVYSFENLIQNICTTTMYICTWC